MSRQNETQGQRLHRTSESVFANHIEANQFVLDEIAGSLEQSSLILDAIETGDVNQSCRGPGDGARAGGAGGHECKSTPSGSRRARQPKRSIMAMIGLLAAVTRAALRSVNCSSTPAPAQSTAVADAVQRCKLAARHVHARGHA